MSGALSTSKWKWTWWFLLLAGVSVLAFALGGFIGSQSSTGETAIAFFLGLGGVVGLAVGIIGAVVTFVMTLLRHHSPPAKPVA
jgi:hypothetical protein